MRTIRQIMEQGNIGYVDASIVQDTEREIEMEEHMGERQPLKVGGYTTNQVLDELSEARRLIATGVGLLNLGGNFAQAAIVFEKAASKLHLVQREYEESKRQ